MTVLEALSPQTLPSRTPTLHEPTVNESGATPFYTQQLADLVAVDVRPAGRSTMVGRIPESERALGQLFHYLEKFQAHSSRSMTAVLTADQVTVQAQQFADAVTTPLIEWMGKTKITNLESLGQEQAVISEPLNAFNDLVKWLEASKEEISDLVGVGHKTPYYWQRGGVPRAATVRRLYQTHALFNSMVRRLGEDGFRQWLTLEDLGRRERLFSGETDFLQREAHDILFKRTRPRARPGTWLPDEDDDAEE